MSETSRHPADHVKYVGNMRRKHRKCEGNMWEYKRNVNKKIPCRLRVLENSSPYVWTTGLKLWNLKKLPISSLPSSNIGYE